MKSLKTIILGLVAVMACGAASAKTINPAKEKITVNYAVTAYINAVAHGQNDALKEVMDNNFTFSMLRGSALLNYTKQDLLGFLKSTENIEQDCKTTVSVNESSSDLIVAKVNMQYAHFTRTNYVTLTNTTDGWKITNIYSVFK